MAAFLLRRAAAIAATMLTVSFLVYLVLEADPGQVAVKTLGQFSTEAQRRLWLTENGYDAPLLVRYVLWLGHFVVGQWGESTHFKTPVLPLVMDRLGATGILAGTTFAIMVPLSLVLGILAGLREGSAADRGISLFSVLTTSVPEFASAVFLVFLFVFWLGWLPGASTSMPGESIRELVLPVSVLVLYCTGYLVRMTRAAMVETMAAPYIRTALMKGASPGRIVLRHALRNALAAPVTVIMLQVPWLLSGVIVVEVFFAYKGFGSLLYAGGLNSDINLIEACAMVSVVVVVATQFVSDILTAWLNPRIRLTERRPKAEPASAGLAAAPPIALRPAVLQVGEAKP